MAGEWPIKQLGEIVINLDSKRIPLSSRERERRRGHYPYYGANGVIDYVDDFLFDGLHVLIAEDGSVEKDDGTPFVQIVEGKFWVNNHAHVLRASTDIDTKFLYYALSTIRVRPFLTGSVQAKLSQQNLNRIPIPYPPEVERRAIAAVLGALDDKIELNRRMNRTLEAIAQAVFRHWFVENEEAEGWDVGRLGDEFNLTMGQSPPGETYNETGEGIPFFQGRADFGFRFPTKRVYCTAPTRFAEAGDTLVSVRAPVGDMNMAAERCAIGRGLAAVRHKTGSRSYTYYAMRFIQESLSRFEGEGTVFGSITKADFENLQVIIPPVEKVKEFEKFCFPIDEMIENNEKQSRTLAALRDALLPKLLRGEVRVKDTAQFLEER